MRDRMFHHMRYVNVRMSRRWQVTLNHNGPRKMEICLFKATRKWCVWFDRVWCKWCDVIAISAYVGGRIDSIVSVSSEILNPRTMCYLKMLHSSLSRCV